MRLAVRCVGAHIACIALQDAMARVAGVGKPDNFVTATCNAYWPEVVSSLLPGQDPADRPDLTARVFIQKIKHLLHLLLDCGILGKVKAHVGMIEFQKRGLPHFHLLLVFDEEDKPRTVADVDRLVSAQIPDPDSHPKLYRQLSST